MTYFRPMILRHALLAVLGLAACGPDRASGLPGAQLGVKGDAATDDGAVSKPVDTGVPVEDSGVVVGGDGYPVGPYGKKEGAIFPPLSFSGYRDGSTVWTTISMREYFDPDGSKGVRGVLVIAAAQWCGVCQNEVKWVTPAYVGNYRDRGAKFLTTLLQDGEHRPSTQATATLWRDVYSIPYAVAIDPDLDTLPSDGGVLTLPYTYVIDPRSMRITKVSSAAQTPPTIPALDAVIEKNR